MTIIGIAIIFLGCVLLALPWEWLYIAKQTRPYRERQQAKREAYRAKEMAQMIDNATGRLETMVQVVQTIAAVEHGQQAIAQATGITDETPTPAGV